MGNRADAEGTDVEIYIKPLTDTIHADTSTGAPEKLLALLDGLGFERKTVETAGPRYVWHEVPGHLDDGAKKQLATRAIPTLLMAGYLVNITDGVWDATAYQEAVAAVRHQSTPSPANTTATSAAPPAATEEPRPAAPAPAPGAAHRRRTR
ncbi:hypothetical protein ACFYN0_01345 [Streptomyces sp. NPDC006704]|uniref:hypothetical protein n=1 Tax=Streptomyces sp. NPDC006704 TaxID=3364760 RepID=UPI003684237A